MSAANQARNPQAMAVPQKWAHLIRAEMVRNLPHLEQAQKAQYETGIQSLWNQMTNNPPESPESQAAQAKLNEVSSNLRNGMSRWKAQNQQANAAQAQAGNQPAGQQAGIRPQMQGGQGQAGAAGGPQAQAQAQAASQNPQGPSQGVMDHIQSFQLTLPPNIPPNSPESQKWMTEARQRYANALIKMEQAKKRSSQLQAQLNARQSNGPPMTDAEKQDFTTKRTTVAKVHAESKRFIDTFRQQQTEYKAQGLALQQSGAAGAQPAPGQNGNSAPSSGPNQGTQQSPTTSQQPSQTPQSATAPAVNAPNSAVDAARAQAGGPARSSMSPATAGPAGAPQAPSSQPKSTSQAPSQQPASAEAFPQAHPTPARTNSPQTAQPQSATQAGPPRPLTHEEAIARAAHIYSNGAPTSTPTSATYPSHGHGPPTSREINTQKMPIPKNLNVPPPQSVSMSTARPTYTGGASGTNSMMGQPAIPKLPGYVLEGEGERVLSKKKLDELVRQVTGGGEGAAGEGLTAEVEEAVLQVADDFVDQVITSACKLAKLRQSPTLEIRDIQLILERNYNIRVPGYASDEIRTVRKFAPAQGWSQKMSAVQAAKISGGKTEL